MSGGRHCRDCRLADGRVELQHGEEATECPGLPETDFVGRRAGLIAAAEMVEHRAYGEDCCRLRFQLLAEAIREEAGRTNARPEEAEHPARQRGEGARCSHGEVIGTGCPECAKVTVEPQGGGE